MRFDRFFSLVGAFATTVIVTSPTIVSAQTRSVGSAESFGALAGATLSNTGSTTVAGDIGVGPDGSITGTTITLTAEGSVHDGDAVAVQALLDASETYSDLVEMTCTSNLTGQNLGGRTLATGVYCFDADADLSGGALTLTGDGPWIFVVRGDLTTASGVTVSGSTLDCNGSNVFWVVGDDATIGGTSTTEFVGNVLAHGDVTVQTGVDIDGRVIAFDDTGTVTLTNNDITPCSSGLLLPVHAPVKVTGGGQISVPDPDSAGRANYGFNAKPETDGAASGHLNYINHVSGLHVNGTVTDVVVLTVDDEGSPDLVRFSGTCQGDPDCTFSVTVDDNGEPSTDDRFGIVVQGSTNDETTPSRLVRNGNIQVHLGLTTTTNGSSFRAGDVMAVSASLTRGPSPTPPVVDAYLVLRLPNGLLLSWTGAGFEVGIVPIARGVRAMNFRAVVARLQIPAGTPPGQYSWLSATTQAGTLNLLSDIAEMRFTIR